MLSRNKIRLTKQHSRWQRWAQTLKTGRDRTIAIRAAVDLALLHRRRMRGSSTHNLSALIIRHHSYHPRFQLSFPIPASGLQLISGRIREVHTRSKYVSQLFARAVLSPATPSHHAAASPARQAFNAARSSLPNRFTFPGSMRLESMQLHMLPRLAEVPAASVVLREHWAKRSARIEERLQQITEMTVRRAELVSAQPAATTPQKPAAASAFSAAQAGNSSYDAVHTAPWARSSSPHTTNIEQLTDQVIRQIDNRMIAWRERMGKV